ncbi:MAG: alpha/beta hydrolase-fold protein [Bacteroidales bacterium]|nr:alpha/beta hydrolase-fold protein [Bacteroidales bacterium]
MNKLLFTVIAVFVSSILFAQNAFSQSKIDTKTLNSKVLNADRDYTIYLPKSYQTDSERRYPVLYLLHGMTETNKTWQNNMRLKEVADRLMESGDAKEMIIVTPNAGGDLSKNQWNGYFNMPGWEYETFFFDEFIPFIENNYRVKSDKNNRAVAGLSMGGGGTVVYAQKHSDMFCAAYAMSALVSLNNLTASGDENEITMHLYRSVLANDCIKFVENADDNTKNNLRTVSWFIDCGDDDFLLDNNVDFTRAMKKAAIPYQFRVRDGGHTSEYWHTALYLCIPFVSRNFDN